MFTNIGGKIKALAEALCYIGIVAASITGMIMFSKASAGIGVLIIVGGSLVSWVGGFFAYGFGELIENSAILAEKEKNNIEGEKEGKESMEQKETIIQQNTEEERIIH